MQKFQSILDATTLSPKEARNAGFVSITEPYKVSEWPMLDRAIRGMGKREFCLIEKDSGHEIAIRKTDHKS